MLNPRGDEEGERLKEGGSTRPVRRRERIPMRLRVGERPAGADEQPVGRVVVSTAILRGGELLRIGFLGLRIGLLLNAGETCCVDCTGARVRKKFAGLMYSDGLELADLLRFAEKSEGSMFSES